MGITEIVDLSLRLKATERYEVAERIMRSLDNTDIEIELGLGGISLAQRAGL